MKKVILVGLVALVAGAVHADIYLNFGSSYGFAANDGVSPLLGNGQQALVQLIYVGGNGTGDAVLPGGGVSGDDELLWSGLTEAAVAGDSNTEYGLFLTSVGPIGGYAGGNVIGRIFQDSSASAGSYFFQGHVQLMANFVQSGPLGPPAETYDLGEGGFAQADQIVPIPEPATIGLMGIAGVGMFLARRKARR